MSWCSAPFLLISLIELVPRAKIMWRFYQVKKIQAHGFKRQTNQWLENHTMSRKMLNSTKGIGQNKSFTKSHHFSILTSKEDPNSWLHFTNPTNFRQMGGSSSFRADHQREASSSDRRQSTSSFDSTGTFVLSKFQQCYNFFQNF